MGVNRLSPGCECCDVPSSSSSSVPSSSSGSSSVVPVNCGSCDGTPVWGPFTDFYLSFEVAITSDTLSRTAAGLDGDGTCEDCGLAFGDHTLDFSGLKNLEGTYTLDLLLNASGCPIDEGTATVTHAMGTISQTVTKGANSASGSGAATILLSSDLSATFGNILPNWPVHDPPPFCSTVFDRSTVGHAVGQLFTPESARCWAHRALSAYSQTLDLYIIHGCFKTSANRFMLIGTMKVTPHIS